MADDEFNIDELISGSDETGEDVPRSKTRNTNNTSDTSTTGSTDSSQHPFSVRLDEEYVELVKALAWWKRISQREFLENCITYALKEMDEERLTLILNRYRKEN